MSLSVFDSTPANDPQPVPLMGSTSFCVHNGCAEVPDDEHEAILTQADALHDALYAALNTHSETHPGITYDVIFHAIDCLAYCLRQQMSDDTAEA